MATDKKQRMAGEELTKETPEAVEAKESVEAAASRADQNRATRERIGNDPEAMAERIGGIDRDAYDFSGYSDKEINMAMQGSSFGDKDYARLTGKDIEPPKDDNDEPDIPPPDDDDNTIQPVPGEKKPPYEEGPDPYPSPNPFPMPRPGKDPWFPGKNGPVVDGGFQVGRDLIQNVGKTGNTNTTIGSGNTFGDGTRTGGDYSITLGRNNAGNGGYYR